ncbi:L-threonylcarbamoyladenylate synthase [Mycoplasma nasistruthionis]|uniref:L-threonylcarbamoyladenylate synthase n=1 Tax=Mycoplasma nasistruthionis TaxID=353852 RepID=A0A5B7XV65_9MOLU|nr:Sua5/YciO/YrdC/YwlC family protein [Mycoplasma nasistruthionis]QCZ36420.1 Sua5/YciO/YrdC/YwlC family protein [Mycoplasma nasistruthionis]
MVNKYADIIICSTDTVCGIGGPINDITLKELYELKQRPTDKKIMILVGTLTQAQKFRQWTEKATELAEKVWPGPNSIIINDQGFRMPDCMELRNYLIKNGPHYMTSLNISGDKPMSIEEGEKQFPEVANVKNFCVPSNKPSTIYNLDTDEIIERE